MTKSTELQPCKVRIIVDVNVQHPKDLIEFAKKQYDENWFDEEWEPESVSEAVLEALVISNMNPSTDEYGIEISKFSHEIINEGAI